MVLVGCPEPPDVEPEFHLKFNTWDSPKVEALGYPGQEMCDSLMAMYATAAAAS